MLVPPSWNQIKNVQPCWWDIKPSTYAAPEFWWLFSSQFPIVNGTLEIRSSIGMSRSFYWFLCVHLPIYEILTEKLYVCIPSVFCTEQDNILDDVASIENHLFMVTKIKQKIRWWNQFPDEIHSFPVLYFIIAFIILFLFRGRIE